MVPRKETIVKTTSGLKVIWTATSDWLQIAERDGLKVDWDSEPIGEEWDAATAAKFRDADLSPSDVDAAADKLIEDADESYTDGSPIYAACNNDISADDIIAVAKVAEYVSAHDDEDDHDADELERLFVLAYGRKPDDDDREHGLWSMLCAAVN